jgi:hypothetical protein
MADVQELRKMELTEFAKAIGTYVENNATEEVVESFWPFIQSAIGDRGKVDQESLFRHVLAICITIACQASADVQKKLLDKVLAALSDIKLAPNASDAPLDNGRLVLEFIINELSYAEQFLNTYELRSNLFMRLQEPIDKIPRSHTVRDYTDGWEMLKEFHRPQEPRNSELAAFEVILVGSMKGGVGKSLVSIALANYYTEQGSAPSEGATCLIDLDVLGPTLQFSLNLRKVAEGLQVKSSGGGEGPTNWPYPTFLDLLERANDTSNTMPMPDVSTICLDYPLNNRSVKVVVLPDSPTVTSTHIADLFFKTVARIQFLEAIKHLLDSLKKANFRRVIIDLAPGLYGTNGLLFHWLTAQYPTSLVLVSSPRSFDIGSSLYEGFWLSPKEFLPWHRPILHLLNMRDELEMSAGSDVLLRSYVDNILNQVISHDFRESIEMPTSGQYVLFWRLRSYLYKIALDCVQAREFRRQYDIQLLPYREELRTLAQEELLKGIKLNTLIGSPWYEGQEVSGSTKYPGIKQALDGWGKRLFPGGG